MITRAQWAARYACDDTVDRDRRTGVHVHHTLLWASEHADCARAVRQIEAQHHRQWGYSVGYNMLVCAHGTIWEGCGIDRRGQHAPGHNTTSVAVAYMGDGRRPVPEAVIETIGAVLAHLESPSVLGRRLAVYGHRDTYATECPGGHLHAALGRIRAYADTPPRPAAAPPRLDYRPALEVDMQLTPLHITFRPDADGRGWVRIPHPIDTVVSVLPHSEVRPGVDGRYDAAPNTIAVTPDGDGTILVFGGCDPRFDAHAWVRIAS